MKQSTDSPPKQRIAFVINSMEGGGAERVLSILLDQLVLSFKEVDVYLILLDRKIERYAIPTYTNKITLDCQGSIVKSILSLRQALQKIAPDVVLSFLNRANCANIIAARFLGYRCIVSERVNTSSHFGAGVNAWLNKIIIRLLYPLADRVLAVSKGVGSDLQTNFGVSSQRIEVIYNPYDLDRLATLAAQPPALQITGNYIVSVGRLVPNKNFALLIRAYHQARLDEKLLILGEGPELSALQHLIAELQLEDKVILAGFLDNPYPVMSRARFAVFSSLAEGFPNAMAEAMALSLPVIASDCDSGPAEILHDVIHVDSDAAFKADFGVLVPVNDLAAMIQALHWMRDEALRDHYRSKSRERISNFGIERAVSQYFMALKPQP
jgi:glycosyltransferase involved in cell wall biosynthesis